MDLSGYVFENLREDREYVTYRCRQPGDPVAILVRAPIPGLKSATALAKLEHECGLAGELDSSWAARPLELVRHDGRVALVLEDPGGTPLDSMLGEPLELTRFLTVAIGLTAALQRVHRSGLIHRDVKPANVLVDDAGCVRLTGFGIASRLPRDHQAPKAPEGIAGTLAYMAPEQTGRMNRSVDVRSDLYSLGVTLYEMLTGTLPFTASDPMEWIHCHIARQPAAPSTWVASIPAPVDAIILKLLSKSAEERYQTAAGLEADLRECLRRLGTGQQIEQFPLAAHDISDRLLIPERLYGREAEISALVAAFDRVVANGAAELVLVSGYSGIGKSAVVNELLRVLVPSRGLFATGKFDQHKRDIPYATLAQALQSLVRQILGRDDGEMARWRDALLEALGPNGQLMINLIPELVAIIGEQPPVPEVPPQDTQNRFQMVFRRFLGVFARPEHPLALFLDDLQWLDSATLTLIEHLVTHPEVRHLLLVGAYRDNEVASRHPLMLTLTMIRAAGSRPQEVRLAPLDAEDVERLLADTLRAERNHVRPLASLVFAKTGGNPFFTIQFLTALAEESLLVFDIGEMAWVWDLPRISAKGYSDNVAHLMAAKLGRLPRATQEALGQLACLGHVAEITTLAMVHGSSEDAIQAALWQAVQAGLVLRLDDTYAFVHDRVQEAAYALVGETERSAAHLRIGRLLASRATPEILEENIFEIVNHLDRGAELITAQEERDRVAEFNLIAGKRAKAATAFTAALQYFAAGRRLLAEDAWTLRYRLTLELELGLAECEYLTGQLASAHERLSALSARAQSIVDLAAVTRVGLNLYTNLDQSDRAIGIGFDFLHRFGIEWSLHPTDAEVNQELARMRQLVAGRPIEQLLDLPFMRDPDWLAAMGVLAELLPPARFTDNNLHNLILLRMTNLSLRYGNCDASCVAYSVLSIVLGPRFGDYQAGLRFAKLGCDLVDHRGLDRFKARVYMCFGAFAIPWTKHLPSGRPHLRRALEAANAAGDQNHAMYSFKNLIGNLLISGEPLKDVQAEAERALAFAQKARFGLYIDVFLEQLMLIRSLRGLTQDAVYYPEAAGHDDRWFERHLDEGGARLALAASWYWIHKMQACFFARDYAGGIEAAWKAEDLLWSTRSHLEIVEFHFYGALTRAAGCSLAPADERESHFQALLGHHGQIAVWAENCPENFENRVALVGAEIARLEGRELDAERLYEQAIRSASRHGFIQNEGLGYELAANFYAARGLDTVAEAYLWKARSCYVSWGADGKVLRMDQSLPQLAQESRAPSANKIIDTHVGDLDIATIIKMSQALSGEIDLRKLIDTLMVLAVKHVGAERCLLILPHSDEMWIEAEATTGSEGFSVAFGRRPASSQELPETVLRYVARSGESIILDDATAPNQFSNDDYVVRANPRSVLCLPLVKQTQLAGVLYLENNLSPYAFTADRISVLQLLASQAAISLENAQLYSGLQHAEERARRSEQEIRLAVDTIPALAWSAMPDGPIEFLNKQWLDYTGLSRDQGILDGWQFAFHQEDLPDVLKKWTEILASRQAGEVEARMRRFDGIYRHFLVRARPLTDETGNVVRWYGTNTDIDDRKKAETLLTQEKRLLEMIAAGRSLTAILEALCRMVEEQTGGSLSSILLLDEGGKHLRHCVAPNFPAGYLEALQKIPVGPAAGSCGTAAFRGERVFVSDIGTDPLWADYRDLALSHGLKACWSTPLLSSAGSVLGTFALYSRNAREITPSEVGIMEQFTHLASIAVERKRSDENLRASLDEKEALLKEVHHRVKNNLQLISSLLNLQSSRIADPAVSEQFDESRNRVRSMALVHENLYRAGNFARVPMRAHIRRLCVDLMGAYGMRGRGVELATDIDDVELDLDRAISSGLIINELVSNALKHAFPDGRRGRVAVELKLLEGRHCTLEVKDDGVGLSSDFDVEHADTLGLQLVHDLTQQLHGVITLERNEGTSFMIRFDTDDVSQAAM